MAGTLSVTVAIGAGAAAALTGAGALSANAVMALPVGSGLTGIGALSGVAVPQMLTRPALSGGGALAATPAQIYFAPATLSGAGAMSATASIIPQGPARDVVGPGFTSSTGGAGTATMPMTGVTAGSYLLVPIEVRATTITAVTFAGLSMTLNKTFTNGNITTSLWGLANVPGGTNNVVATVGSLSNICMNGVTYNNVTAVSAAQTASGTTNPMTQIVSCAANQMIFQIFGGFYVQSAFSGGTNLSALQNGVTSSLSINEAAASTTFSANQASAAQYAAQAVVLS